MRDVYWQHLTQGVLDIEPFRWPAEWYDTPQFVTPCVIDITPVISTQTTELEGAIEAIHALSVDRSEALKRVGRHATRTGELRNTECAGSDQPPRAGRSRPTCRSSHIAPGTDSASSLKVAVERCAPYSGVGTGRFVIEDAAPGPDPSPPSDGFSATCTRCQTEVFPAAALVAHRCAPEDVDRAEREAS